MTTTLHNYLVVGAILFAMGLIGFLARRNMILMFLSVEMMLQGVAVNLVAFSRYRGNFGGQALTLFILTVAACEAAIALVLILMLFRSRKSLDVSLWQELREEDQDPIVDEERRGTLADAHTAVAAQNPKVHLPPNRSRLPPSAPCARTRA